MMSIRMIMEQDCTVLLERALLRMTLCAFGEDGCGLHGQHDTPMYFTVSDIRVDIFDEPPYRSGKVSICLRGYDETVVGHIQTDRNFDISLKTTLEASGVSMDGLTWAPIDEQVHGCVTFYVDTSKLLG